MTWRPFEQCKENLEQTEKPGKPITEIPTPETCAVCGHPRYPHNYRHVFRSMKSCSLHTNCGEADDVVRQAGGRWVTVGDLSVHVWTAQHE